MKIPNDIHENSMKFSQKIPNEILNEGPIPRSLGALGQATPR